MDEEYYIALSKVRLDRAKELLAESKSMIGQEYYKTANNRAFYAMEKAVRALLARRHIEPLTHSGVIKQFNLVFVHNGDGYFEHSDFEILSKAEQIRNVSDYDDFYIANKLVTRNQVENAEYMIRKVEKYLDGLDAGRKADQE